MQKAPFCCTPVSPAKLLIPEPNPVQGPCWDLPLLPLGIAQGSMVAPVSADPLAASLLLLQEAVFLWSQEWFRRMSQCRSPRQEEIFLSSFSHRQLAITLPPAGVTT